MARKNFDLKELIQRYDRHNVGLSIASFPEQVRDVARTFPGASGVRRKKWNAVFVCAMGGSALGADILRYAYGNYLTVPLIINNSYELPGFVNRNTLVVCITYSGTTEEAIQCMRESKKRGTGLFVISKGNAIAREARAKRIPQYVFDPVHNPSKQPRIGTGYTMAALYLLLREQGILPARTPDIERTIAAAQVDTDFAETLARRSLGKSLVIVAAEHLRGNAHVISNQMNESAKTFAPFYFMSELNHHLMEGLQSLRVARRHWLFVFLESRSYTQRMQKRFALTRQVVARQGFRTEGVVFSGNRIVQSMAALMFGGFWSYYLAILSKRDPSKIPWVDYFKRRLG